MKCALLQSNIRSVDEILPVSMQMNAIEQSYPLVLFIMPNKVIFTFEAVDEIPKCDHSNESY